MNLDGRYLSWLYRIVEQETEVGYWELLKILYQIRFIWSVRNDDNRAEEGRDLRLEFIMWEGLDHIDKSWIEEDCSVLEMMVALSRRMSMQSELSVQDSFWEMIRNLGFEGYSDQTYVDAEHVDEHLASVMDRRYEPDGQGSFFCIDECTKDMRGVELLYQMYAYLMERGEVWTSST